MAAKTRRVSTCPVLLAGFTGAMIIHSMVDAALGFTPTEYGPWYVHYPPSPISRLRTLLRKWGIVAVTAPIVSAIILVVATILGMPISVSVLDEMPTTCSARRSRRAAGCGWACCR